VVKRRALLQGMVGSAFACRSIASAQAGELERAADVLAQAVDAGQVHAAALSVQRGEQLFARHFGLAQSSEAIFLLASISKPMSVAALMSLHDQNAFNLDDRVQKFLPESSGDLRERITVRQLLTHISGLPDQLPQNIALRQRHAPLSDFVTAAIRTPLLFTPGSRYHYSSMGILLASEIASRISGIPFTQLISERVFQPAGMKHSALGLGRFQLSDTMQCQVERAAQESGAGDPAASDWDWNSPYWRNLASPWGGVHASATDVVKFFNEFLHPTGRLLDPKTVRTMLSNHNPPSLTRRGLGFGIGIASGSPGCSERTFGHTGSTGTLAWADPATDTICVVLTTLPANAVKPHPRQTVSDLVAQ
jgi:CubicO group peptidase (beta-lactamase class C family)